MPHLQGVEYDVPDEWEETMCKFPRSVDVRWHNVTDSDTGAWRLQPSGLKFTEWAFQCPVGGGVWWWQ